MSFPPPSPQPTVLPRLLLAAALLVVAACAPSSQQTDAWRSAATERWGEGSFETLELNLPAPVAAALAVGEVPREAPHFLHLPLTLDGQATTLDLAQHSVRDPEFAAQVWQDESGYRLPTAAEAPAAPLTYRGSAAGMPDLTVLAAITNVGLRALILPTHGEPLRLMAAREVDPAAPATTYLLGPAQTLDAIDLHCEAIEPDFDQFEDLQDQSTPPPPGGMIPPTQPDCVSLAQIAFDCDYQYYLNRGSSVPNTIARVESHLNEVDYHYARDVRITMRLSHIIVRTTQFYFPNDGGDLLNIFGNEWNTNLAHIPRDLAHLMTAKNNIQYGGLAWVGTVCTSLAYAWSLDSAGIVSHEVGHNWGSGHCHDGSPCNNMCGACLYIAPNTRQIISNFRDSRWCLETVPYRSPVPPYTDVPDSVAFLTTEIAAGPALIDPLANDVDGNCDPVQLESVDATTAQGVPLETLQGPQPDGRDRVIYDNSAAPRIGLDTFTYQAASKDGLTSDGTVTINVQPARQLQHWQLDEGSGTTSSDRLDSQRVATLNGATWTAGYDGQALAFDGNNDSATLPAGNFTGRHLTVTMWVKREGPATLYPGLLMTRGSANSGFHLGTYGELRYTWANDGESRKYNSKLVTPTGEWVFVALVVAPETATFYMIRNGQLEEATRVASHRIESFSSAFTLGHDPDSANSRYFEGAIDDVRVFHDALTRQQIIEAAQFRGMAESPLPADGAAATAGLAEVSWTPDPQASSHDVYFGLDYWSVALADTNDPEYLGSTASDRMALPPLQGDTRYYWRVDSRFPEVSEGRVWQFELPPAHHWPADETFGDRIADIGNGLDGRAWNGVQLGEPGATTKTGTSLRFDGNDDRVEIPALGLYGDRMTIAGWAKRNGRQDDFTGLVFARSGGTIAGLHLGDAHDLRYTWNADPATYGWTSGIKLPVDEWVFVALVVEPGQATIYRGRNGSLSSATNTVPHGPEEWDGPWMLGRDPAAGRAFNGWLDDIRVWRSALSSSEIQAIYDATR